MQGWEIGLEFLQETETAVYGSGGGGEGRGSPPQWFVIF